MPLAKMPSTTFAPTARHRTLGAGLLAVMAGSVITSDIAAGAAASITDLAPTNPNAELANPDAANEACAALTNPIADSWNGMLDRMGQSRATSSEGLAARAFALAQQSSIKPGTSSYPFAFQPGETNDVTGRLLHMLLTDASRMIGGPLPVLDADLLALRPEFDRLHALIIDFSKNLILDGGTECADFDALCDRIASSDPAVTAEGRTFQAAAAMHHLTYRLNDCEQALYPAWLFLRRIAGDAYQSAEVRA